MKKSKAALIVVDLQNDFMPGGRLGVQHGDDVVPVANKLMPHFDLVVASKDWHPKNHGVFANFHPDKKAGEVIHLGGIDQILWPEHCVQDTHGSEFVSTLHTENIDEVIKKGTDPKLHSYSTFFDDAHLKETGLNRFLKGKGITDVYLLGLATDYCVKYSVLDAIHLGFKAHVIVDGCKPIEVHQGDSQRAFDAMKKAGAHLMTSDELLAALS